MATVFSPTHEESALVNQIFAKYDPHNRGIIPGDVAVRLFSLKLSATTLATTLGQIWSIADTNQQGFLTREGVSVAVRLLGWAQDGEPISVELVNKPGPLPFIDWVSFSAEFRRAVSPSPKSPGTSRLPAPLTAQDKATFAQYFSKCNPVNGVLSGEKALEVFVKSMLPDEQLAQIWDLSDTQNRGSLDVADFIVAMYLIRASMAGQLPSIPTTLPIGLYEMASDQTLSGSTVASHTTGNSGPFFQGMPDSFPQTSGSGIVQPQLTGKQLQPQYSGDLRDSILFAFTAPQSQLAWDVTPIEKASADKCFDSLDTQKKGYIEADISVPFMLQSKLPGADLASIWDLGDLNNDGRLTRDGFAVAFHLIQERLSGKEIPTTLPASLMPPSMRAVAAPTTSPFQQFPSDSLKDFLWEDSPMTSQPQSAILQPQRIGHTQSPAISTSHTQGQNVFGFSRRQASSSSDTHAIHGAFPIQKATPGELEPTDPLQITRDRNIPGPNNLPWLLPGMNDKPRRFSEEGDDNEGSTEHHVKLMAPDASPEKEVARLEHERQLSEILAAQTERDRRISQLTDQLAQKSALLEQAEVNAAEAKKHTRLELRELQAKLDESVLSRDEHLRALEQAQSALQKATSHAAGADERSQPVCEHETELADVRAELERKMSELEAVRLRLTDAENRCAESKAEADTLRAGTRAAAGLVNMDVDRVMQRLMERVRAVEDSVRGNEKSIESMECRNEG